MERSGLVRMFGFPATLIHGDPLVLDRWLWLRRRLPATQGALQVLDVGCGTGAFTIGAARRGYRALGLSWDERNQHVAAERARVCGASAATFRIVDVRALDGEHDLIDSADVVLCLENIEHILDDAKLMRDMAACLKPGGKLLLTTPNVHYRRITRDDDGPFRPVEAGGHVRRGYDEVRLVELCRQAGLSDERISYCSGFLSQKITWLMRVLSDVHPLLAWGAVLPLRPLPPLLDGAVTRMLRWPAFSICLEARKPG
ncbi:MAG: methyltransferase domain-containing protein [Pseudomonadota bacterium]